MNEKAEGLRTERMDRSAGRRNLAAVRQHQILKQKILKTEDLETEQEEKQAKEKK